MATAVYLSRFAPAFSVVKESEAADASNNFSREMTARLLQIMELLNRAELLPLTSYENPDRPRYHLKNEGGTQVIEKTECILNYGVRTDNTGLYTVIGKTPYGDHFLLSRLIHAGPAQRVGKLDLLRDELGEVELGIFSSDHGFVDCVRSRMEYGLPQWIENSEPKKLGLWVMEENYAIALKRRFIFS